MSFGFGNASCHLLRAEKQLKLVEYDIKLVDEPRPVPHTLTNTTHPRTRASSRCSHRPQGKQRQTGSIATKNPSPLVASPSPSLVLSIESIVVRCGAAAQAAAAAQRPAAGRARKGQQPRQAREVGCVEEEGGTLCGAGAAAVAAPDRLRSQCS
jgi:hypothetical protein